METLWQRYTRSSLLPDLIVITLKLSDLRSCTFSNYPTLFASFFLLLLRRNTRISQHVLCVDSNSTAFKLIKLPMSQQEACICTCCQITVKIKNV